MAKIKALVTGGSGFLGQHVVRQLVETGKYEVVIFDIREGAYKDAAVKTIVGDLRKPESVKEACRGMQVVFHVATAAITGANATNEQLMTSVNIDGTKNIVEACRTNGVPKLIFTSTASVVFEGKRLDMVTEEHPYATKPFDFYTMTKIEAEKIVLAANGKDGVATCALRPSGIFGEGDLLMVPTIVKQARKGKMKFIIGDGKNEMDFTYVGNVAQSHVEAADALLLSSPLAGSAYFITNQEPLPFWTMLGNVCEGLEYKRPSVHLPRGPIMLLAALFEYVIAPVVGMFKKLETDFTVNRILLASTHRTFSCAKAKKDFGYVPKVSMREALSRTMAHFSHLKRSEQEGAKLKSQ